MVQVSFVEAVGLGLASDPLGVCIFFRKGLVLEVALDLIDPASVLAYQGQQQAIALRAAHSLVLHLLALAGAPR